MPRLQKLLDSLAVTLGTDAELARQIGVSPGLVSRWLNEGGVPEPDRMPRLRELSGLSEAALNDRDL